MFLSSELFEWPFLWLRLMRSKWQSFLLIWAIITAVPRAGVRSNATSESDLFLAAGPNQVAALGRDGLTSVLAWCLPFVWVVCCKLLPIKCAFSMADQSVLSRMWLLVALSKLPLCGQSSTGCKRGWREAAWCFRNASAPGCRDRNVMKWISYKGSLSWNGSAHAVAQWHLCSLSYGRGMWQWDGCEGQGYLCLHQGVKSLGCFVLDVLCVIK